MSLNQEAWKWAELILDHYQKEKGISIDKPEGPTRRTKRINLRVTPEMAEDIKAEANYYGLTITDYLLKLHIHSELKINKEETNG